MDKQEILELLFADRVLTCAQEMRELKAPEDEGERRAFMKANPVETFIPTVVTRLRNVSALIKRGPTG